MMPEPLEPFAEALVEAERLQPLSVDDAARQRVLLRLEGTLAVPLAAATALGSSSGASAGIAHAVGVKWAAALLLAGAVVGSATTVVVMRRLPPHESVRVVEVPVVREVPVPASGPPEAAVKQRPPTPAPVPTRPQVPNRSPAQVVESTLNDEQPLLETARTALLNRRPDAALAALRQHGATFAHGALSEERDALWVQALVLAGDDAGAAARAHWFREQYPNSILRAAVDQWSPP